MTPGFHKISADKYHADCCVVPSLSSSVAQILLRESPRKAWHRHPRLNPDYREEHDGKFDLGTAAHAVLLEDDQSKIVIVPHDDWRTKAAKQARGDAYAVGKTPLLERHHAAVMRMVEIAKAFIASSEIADYWKDAESELTGIALEDGVWLRCLFDRITKNRRLILDYKTSNSAAPEDFHRQIARMSYDVQHAFYRRVASNLGVISPRFVFLCQSCEQPHECSLHGLDPAAIDIADAKVERAIRLWRSCMERKSWPSYDRRIHYMTPTAWQMAEHEMALTEAA